MQIEKWEEEDDSVRLMERVFKSHSYEILEFLEIKDINNLKNTSRIMYDVCECHTMFLNSIKSLDKLFIQPTPNLNNTNNSKINKSKFKEKFEFNKSIDVFKGTDIYNKRIQSAMRKKNKEL
jgi:hypothetical protein